MCRQWCKHCDLHIKKFNSSSVSFLVSLTGIGSSKDKNSKKISAVFGCRTDLLC